MTSRDALLAPNFALGEFIRPQDPVPASDILHNLTLLAQRLQVVRDITCKRITITSGYRAPAHNAAVGGSKDSYHLRGMAADIVIEGMSPSAVQRLLRDWSGGLGSYGTWTHVDIGPRRRWNG